MKYMNNKGEDECVLGVSKPFQQFCKLLINLTTELDHTPSLEHHSQKRNLFIRVICLRMGQQLRCMKDMLPVYCFTVGIFFFTLMQTTNSQLQADFVCFLSWCCRFSYQKVCRKHGIGHSPDFLFT